MLPLDLILSDYNVVAFDTSSESEEPVCEADFQPDFITQSLSTLSNIELTQGSFELG